MINLFDFFTQQRSNAYNMMIPSKVMQATVSWPVVRVHSSFSDVVLSPFIPCVLNRRNKFLDSGTRKTFSKQDLKILDSYPNLRPITTTSTYLDFDFRGHSYTCSRSRRKYYKKDSFEGELTGGTRVYNTRQQRWGVHLILSLWPLGSSIEHLKKAAKLNNEEAHLVSQGVHSFYFHSLAVHLGKDGCST